jgi:C1A family cysteine protease
MRALAALLILAGTAFGGVPQATRLPLSQLTGLQTPANWKELAPWKDKFLVDDEDIPKFFDWRFYAQGLTKINFQKAGDCWAQGTVGVLESLIKINHGVEEKMSVQEIISCSGSGSAARGGYFAHEYHKVKGGADEAQFPYTARDIRCKAGLQPKYHLKAWGYIGAQNRRPTTIEMKKALMEHGPIGVTITANGALQRFSGSGVFKGCSNGGTNHIEVIVGWDDSEGGGVWFVRNSWGESHGDKGYAKIPFGCSRIGEQATWADLEMPEQP